MLYSTIYKSIIGNITIVCNDNAVVGLLTENQKPKTNHTSKDNHPVLLKTKNWLDSYFAGENPSTNEISVFTTGTPFQQDVWKLLLDIPYGKTVTYGDIAKTLAKKYGKEKMSARAVGKAIGSNKILIIIPCHRVIGKNGNLTGFAGGLNNKSILLKHEHIVV